MNVCFIMYPGSITYSNKV